MKQTWKKITGLMLVAICTFALTACGKEEGVKFQRITDEMVDTQCTQLASGLVDALAALDDETMDTIILNERQDFSRQIAEEWKTQTETLGAFVEKGEPEIQIDRNANQVTVKIPAAFENNDGVASFVFNYNKDYDAMVPGYMTLTEVETFAGNMRGAVINTVMGVGTVFVVLVFLIFVISLFKYVGKIGNKKETAAPAPKAAPVQKAAAPVVEEDLTDDLELVAVISAAIAASENTSTDSFVVRSIKKVNRSKWQRA